MTINWGEFKEYKKYTHSNDNFSILLDFMRSYYNMNSPIDIFDVLCEDDTAQLMLEKRNIVDAEGLEKFLFKIK
jgi:hypothetical protein